MPSDNDDKFACFTLPDISKVDPTKITKFSTRKDVSKWRIIHKGLNLEGMCKNKTCQAYQKMVWTGLGYGSFFMSEQVCKSKCPICSKPTKGNKRIGIHKCQLKGRGMKVKKTSDDQDTDDEAEQTKASDATVQQQQSQNASQDDEEVEIEFDPIKCDSIDGFLKMDGVNGPFVQWRYMTLEIQKLKKE